ncbi:tRNA (adenosine(37)-N6)-dimethylallyltransferase MiaA [Candidatus Saccharibacteria bacterium]|nr:tRNA (adenosine(37)-N6)-dimethylallyltransferase MiaA [Candidatus Saccharibacteria bacterium]
MAGKAPVIIGPTGSGKTGVAVEIAEVILEQLGREVEIIAADSRTIYRGMDIGTAKPSLEERRGVKHYGFDLVEPGERFTVKEFKGYAEEKITESIKRGKIPMVVGGTGLYVDALIYDYQFETPGKGYGRERGECIKNLNGRKGVLKADDAEKYPDRQKMCSRYRVFGILWSAEELRARLLKRADKMFVQELFEETARLVEKYGWGSQAMKSNIYKFAWSYMRGEVGREEAIRLVATDDWHLAKRQMTWFRRNPEIEWFSLEEMKPAVIKCIQNEYRK